MEFICVNRRGLITSTCVYLSPYRLHLFGDGGELLNFGPQFISLPVHHFLQFQHHLPLLPLDAVCTHTHTNTVSIVTFFELLTTQCVFYLKCQDKKKVYTKAKKYFMHIWREGMQTELYIGQNVSK